MRTAILLFTLVTQLPATSFTIFGDPADTQVQKFGIFGGDPRQNQGQNGLNGSFDYSMVFVFQLPTLAPGQTITSAEFSPYVLTTDNNSPTDLYGLAYRLAPTVLASDWYTGLGDANNTLIQSSFLTQNFAFSQSRVSTSASGNAALLNYINAQYANGATGGNYIFLRLSTHSTNPTNALTNFFYAADIAPFLVANSPGTTLARWQEQFSPMLNVTIETTATPEPLTFLSVGLGLCAAALFRRPKP